MRWVGWVLFFTTAGLLAGVANGRPAWNLDGVFYSGASLAVLDDPGADSVHEAVYEEIEQVVPAKPAAALTNSSGYRRRLARDPAAFEGQLPFYTVKRVYVAAVAVARAFGMRGITGAHFVSAVSLTLFVLALAGLARQRTQSDWIALVGALIMGFSSPVMSTATLASPDMMCAAWIVGAMALCTSRARVLGYVCCSAAVLTRPDAAIYTVGLVLPWTLILGGATRHAVGGIGVATGVGVMPALLGDGYGWSMTMRQTFFGATTHLDRLRVPIVWDDYLVALNKGVSGYMALDTGGYVLFLVVFAVAVGVARMVGPLGPSARRLYWATFVGWAAAAAHVLAFPLIADRLLLPAYAVSAVALISSVDRVVGYFVRGQGGGLDTANEDA